MERYTEKHYDGNGYYLICSGNCETFNCGDCGILDKIVDRLAAYEDTGLEPCDYSAMAHALEQAERAREDLTEMIRQIGATGLDRLRELDQADREGISPCTFCRFNLPSSGDGKPCCMCPAEAALHGRWIFEPGKIPYCSECKEYSDDGDKGATFCPWCGARMGEEDEHEAD